MKVVELNSENFENEVLKFNGKVIVDFFATWCGPCKMQSPIIDEIASENNKENVKICKIDVDEAPEMAEKYDVMSIPTIIIFENGEIKKQYVGLTQKEEIVSNL